MRYLNTLIAHFFIICRPFLGPAFCPFNISCGVYAIAALKKYSLPIALYRITKRLIACSPLYPFIDTAGLHSLE